MRAPGATCWRGLLRELLRSYPTLPSVVLWRAMESRMIDSLPGTPAGPLLDLGCGDGAFLDLLGLGDGAHVCDMVPRAVRQARRNLPRAHPAVADARRLPYRTGAFRTVVSNCALEHVEDLPAALEEIHRILGPGGEAIISVPTDDLYRRFLPARLWRLMGLSGMARRSVEEHRRVQGIETLLSPEGWTELFEEAGFRVMNRRVGVGPRAGAVFTLLDAVWQGAFPWPRYWRRGGVASLMVRLGRIRWLAALSRRLWSFLLGSLGESRFHRDRGMNLVVRLARRRDRVGNVPPDCPICGGSREEVYRLLVLDRHRVGYYHCDSCGLTQTEEPRWLADAHEADPVSPLDTGHVARSLATARLLSWVVQDLFGKDGHFVDLGGGTGLLTRLMRDRGFDFRWDDAYSTNVFARGFEAGAGPVDALTAFEVLEHVHDPLAFLEGAFRRFKTRTILLSTLVAPQDPPDPDWWYLSLDTGQHVSLFQGRTLDYLARRLGGQAHSLDREHHLITDRPVDTLRLHRWRSRSWRSMRTLMEVLRGPGRSRVWEDHLFMKESRP